MSAKAEPTRQLVLLAGSFFALTMFFDSGWTLMARQFRGAHTGRSTLRNRLSGGLLMGAGQRLALARRP